MTEVQDLIAFFEDFKKHPILPSQNAQILCAMIDGTITATTAKQILAMVVESNLKKYNEFINMSMEEILNLMDEYGIERQYDEQTL